MTALDAALTGALFGVAIAAPVGPIALLCIERTLRRGPRAGVASGLGAATADALYGTLVGLGLVAFADALLAVEGWLRPVGGLLLVALGVLTVVRAGGEAALDAERRSLAGDYLTTLALTLSNPVTVLAFVGVFAGVGVAPGDALTAAALVGGVFCGSTAWWLVLAGAVALVRDRVTGEVLTWVTRGAGVLIVGFGVWTLAV